MTDKAVKRQDTLNAPVEEAYRALRTNIQFCGIDNKIRTLAITSCNPGEGKTTTSYNLSVSMVKTGMKTLLIDTDLRKPSLSCFFNFKSAVGLTNYLSGFCTLDEIICKTDEKGLYFIDCGPRPPNPAEILGSIAFKEFISDVKEQFDIVIFDTPPLGSVIDPAIIASQTDGTILVVRAKSTDYRVAKRVMDQLDKANARLLGVVLNKVKKSDYRNYSNYYYNYYGSTKESSRKGWTGKFKLFGKNGRSAAYDRYTQPFDIRGG